MISFSLPHFFRFALLLMAIHFFSQGVYAQAGESKLPVTESLKDFFSEEGPLSVSLTFDIKKLTKNKRKDIYQDATIAFLGPDSVFHQHNIQVKARGNRRREVCYLPPIKLNFKNIPQSEDSLLHDLHSIKLVTHCKNSKAHQQYLLKEYFAYKLFNLFTPYSFQVRLLQINYIDSQGKREPEERMGFLIEKTRKLAARLNSRQVEQKGIGQASLISEHIIRLAILQYMIGNDDWKVPSMHNIKLIIENDFSVKKAIPIAYDFDYSGLVNAYYALPNEAHPRESVRDRVYLGDCQPEDQLAAVLEEFLTKKEAVYALLAEQNYFDSGTQYEVKEYLDEFYKAIENKHALGKIFMDGCLSSH